MSRNTWGVPALFFEQERARLEKTRFLIACKECKPTGLRAAVNCLSKNVSLKITKQRLKNINQYMLFLNYSWEVVQR